MTTSKPSEKRAFKEVTIEPGALGSRLSRLYPMATVTASAPQQGYFRDGKRRLHIGEKHGAALHLCSSLHRNYCCCNTHVLRSMSNCPFDCSYCFLQNYLTNATTMVVADIGALIREIEAKTASQPWRLLRIGTWELADSLALETELGSASELSSAFRNIRGALLEFKTKSAIVEPLINLDHGGRTIISWSVNPEAIINAEEHGTSTLDERLAAMRRVYEAGYKISLHFDPIIYYPNWREGYRKLVQRIFAMIPPTAITWISMGVLRFNPEMKKKVEDNFPTSKITSAEMVLGYDGKVRYVKPLRLEMYREVYHALREAVGADPLIYLCMESSDVWERVVGYAPRSIGHLDFLFADSLYRRFPGLVDHKPNIELYEAAGEDE